MKAKNNVKLIWMDKDVIMLNINNYPIILNAKIGYWTYCHAVPSSLHIKKIHLIFPSISYLDREEWVCACL